MGLTDCELSILLTDDEEIHRLNSDFRSVDAPTDVLSFPMTDPDELDAGFDGLLGDIVISVDTAERQVGDQFHQDRMGQEGEWDLLSELSFLLVHGLLHLVGYDHHEDEGGAAMKEKELELFNLCLK